MRRLVITRAALCVVMAMLPVSDVDAPAAANQEWVADGTTTLGAGGWQVQSSALVPQAGGLISSPGFDTTAWLAVKPDDAGAPGTEIAALLRNGVCPTVFYADTMRKCFGYMDERGPVTVPRFAVPWWFRTDFTAAPHAGQTAELVVNGIVGAGDLWVNGTLVAGTDALTGAYVERDFDVTGLLRAGVNSLAIRMHPNNPNTMFTLDQFDWSQIPPDNNTGIQFPVQLRMSGALTVSNAHVVQDNAADLSRSALTVKADVTNRSSRARSALVTATITPPGGDRPIRVSQTATVAGHSTRTVSFTPGGFADLTVAHPRLWWPYQLGGQPLYALTATVAENGAVTSQTSGAFGIRTVTSRLIGPSPAAPDGVRVFVVNGKQLMFRGGGYVPDLFLRYSSADVDHQIALIHNLGLNGIRLEGHDMPDDFYQRMDRAGIMIDAGFLCCDRWELPADGSGVTEADYRVIHDSARTLGTRLRNHPSVINYSWSDSTPNPRQESESLAGFREADFSEPVIASAEYKGTSTLGPSGEKEGPYDWVPPSYWYDTTHFAADDDSRTNVGGSWGFSSESSAGDTVPTLDSIRRFLSPDDQEKLWREPDHNQYHANYEPGHGGYRFGTLYTFDTALSHRYGSWSDLDSYVRLAQLANYENTRAQFEAFIDHATNTASSPATGVIYWQLNKGWPTLLWSLYNTDGDQAGSFYGAKKANEPLHVLYAYDDDSVAVDNLGVGIEAGLSVESTVYDTNGKVLDERTVDGITLGAQEVRNRVLTPALPAETDVPAAQVSFVRLLLRRDGKVVDRNVYWVSSQKDVVDWPASQGNPQATLARYADYRALRDLPRAAVRVEASTRHDVGSPGMDTTSVTITNTSAAPAVGFFLRADVRRGAADSQELPGDNQVSAAIWDDNDVTLWPGESVTMRASYPAADLKGATPVVSVSGVNTQRLVVAAPG